MKLPRTRKKYCPYCRKHTEHKIAQMKRRQPSSLSHGSKYRAMKRGRARGKGNHGRYSKPAITQWKMTGAKTTKKTDLGYTCSVCHKTHLQRKGIRIRKLEFSA